MFVYVGTYTQADRGGRGEGIHAYRMDAATGDLTPIDICAGVSNPHFLALHPNDRFLYSTNGGEASSISAFAVDDPSGRLTFLNAQPSPGLGPTHLAVDPSGRWVVVANYAGGSVAVFPLEADGRVGRHADFVVHQGQAGPNARRQDAAHAHVAVFDPTGAFVLVCDLGLDRTFVYRLDAGTGKLTEVSAAAAHAGAGPRHLAFHPTGRYAYVINELDSTMTAYAWDGAAGALGELQVVPLLPTGFSGDSIAAEVAVSPDGRFVYGSNRGHDSIAIFGVDPADGTLRLVGHEPTRGRTPRHFDLEPAGRFLYAANQDSDNVVVFHVNADSGHLELTGHVTAVGTPSCIVFRPWVRV